MGGVASAVGGIFGQTAQAFTPQNNYSFNSGGQDLQALLNNTQGQTATNVANQTSLAQQLLAQSQGVGPNPAQLQLQQGLDQNQKQGAGMIASQKGINPGLAQKQIENSSANQAQQAAGQGAILGANQQIAAQGQLGGLYNSMQNQNLQNQGQYEGLLNSANATNAGTAAQNTAAVQNTNSGLLQAAGPGIGMLGKGIGGLFYKGGEIPKAQHFWSAGEVSPNYLGADVGQPASSPQLGAGISESMKNIDPYADIGSGTGKWGNGLSQGMARLDQSDDSSKGAGVGSDIGGGIGKMFQGMGDGGSGSASQAIANQMSQSAGIPHWAAGNAPKNSSGVDPAQIAQMAAMFAAHGGMVPETHPAHPVMMALRARGGNVPGQEMVPGDSPKNDIVPAVLSAKEIVLPKSVTMSSNPGDMAKSFVEQIKSKSSGKEGGYAKVLAAKRKASK